MGLFLDVINLDETQTNRALSEIYKAIHDHGDDDAIWDPMDSPFVRRLVELFTERGLTRVEAVQHELQAWMAGHKHNPGLKPPPAPPGVMERWTPAELDLVKIYLQALPPHKWTLDDYMMMVDYLVQRYLPADVLKSEAEWLATRSTLMGKVQANIEKLTDKQADRIVAALPTTPTQAVAQFALTPLQQSILSFAATRAADRVTAFSAAARQKLRAVIQKHVEQQMLRIPGTPGQTLQSLLLDTFGTMNRDWRRIAVTEAGECQTQGYIASLAPGTKVERVEQYKSACGFCKRIHGRVMEVVSPDNPDKDPETQVWVGKDNFGRSSAPRKRVGNALVPRDPEELWWVPAGLVHPHCRGRWLPVLQDEPGEDAEFGEWLRRLLEGKKDAAA
jgi:hypothetical protein